MRRAKDTEARLSVNTIRKYQEKKLQTKEACAEKKIKVELSAAARGFSIFNDMVVLARAKKHPRNALPARLSDDLLMC